MSQKEIAFMGRIIASLSHEIKNVLATIKESAGLMEDILNLLPEKGMPHQDRLGNAAANIKKQVDRGANLVTGLNRFAHSMDEPRAEIDLNVMVGQMAFLMQRFAHKSGIGLESLPYPEPLRMETDPFALEMLLAACLDVCMNQTLKRPTLTIQSCVVGGRPAVWIAPGPTQPPESIPDGAPCPEDLAALQRELGQLHFHIYDLGSAGACGLLIRF